VFQGLFMLKSPTTTTGSTSGSMSREDHNSRFSAIAEQVRDKLAFRLEAVQRANRGERVDEVIYSLQSQQNGAQCNALLVKEMIASVFSLKKFCKRCNFDVVVVADEPIYSFLMTVEARNLSLFDRIELHRDDADEDDNTLTSQQIFASRKPGDLLRYSRKPFVVFMDADITSNHRSFPESIFDMLHKEYE